MAMAGAGWWAFGAISNGGGHGWAVVPAAHRVTRTAAVPAARPPLPLSVAPRADTPTEVAEMYTRAWFSYDLRLPPGTAARSVRPWATPALVALLMSTPGAPALDSARVAAHEHDIVTKVHAAVDDRADGAVGVDVSAEVSVTVVAGASMSTVSVHYLDVWVVAVPDGWRVAKVEV